MLGTFNPFALLREGGGSVPTQIRAFRGDGPALPEARRGHARAGAGGAGDTRRLIGLQHGGTGRNGPPRACPARPAHLPHGEGLVSEGDVGGLPGAQEELWGEAAPQTEHVLFHRRVQLGRVFEEPPLPTVRDDARRWGRRAAEAETCFLASPLPARSEMAPGTEDPVGATAHTHLSSGLSTSMVTVRCVLWGFRRANSKNSAVPSVTCTVCFVVMARLSALVMLSAFVRSR